MKEISGSSVRLLKQLRSYGQWWAEDRMLTNEDFVDSMREMADELAFYFEIGHDSTPRQRQPAIWDAAYGVASVAVGPHADDPFACADRAVEAFEAAIAAHQGGDK